MKSNKLANRLHAIEQTNAIFALEGFKPTKNQLAINAAVLAEKVTCSQVVAEICEYVKEYKTMDGFIQSRTWSDASLVAALMAGEKSGEPKIFDGDDFLKRMHQKYIDQ